jgi:hypothetical protein
LTSIPLPFYDNPLLFGHDPARGLLAYRPADSHVTVYARRDGVVTTTDEPFRPFLLLADPDLLKELGGEVEVTPLDGDGVYRWLAECPSWPQALRARDHCLRASGRARAPPTPRTGSSAIRCTSSCCDPGRRPSSAWPSVICGAWRSTSR